MWLLSLQNTAPNNLTQTKMKLPQQVVTCGAAGFEPANSKCFPKSGLAPMVVFHPLTTPKVKRLYR